MTAQAEHGEISTDLVFHYQQSGKVLTCQYAGGEVRAGQLLGKVDEQGHIEMSYHQINQKGEIRTGVCTSKPEIMPDGKIKLHESWRWTDGNGASGCSTLMEI